MNLNKKILLVMTFLEIFGQACATQPVRPGDKKELTPLVGSFEVQRHELPNGLRVLIVEDHSSPTFAYQTWFRVGSRDERKDYTGLAHLFEHMMFKETKNLKDGEFDKLLEGAGAEGENAFTSRDYTAYVQELPKDKLELIARLEADRMVNLVVNQQAFKTETDVVQNERRYRNENSPDGLMYQELFGLAFTVHPYHWPVVGYQEDLDRMSSQDALDFYKSYYSPNHATIVVSGDVEPKEVLSLIKKYYGALPRQTSPVQHVEAEPAQTSPRRKQLKLNIQIEKLMMGYRVPEITHEDIPVLEVAHAILSGGKSSRLNRALVNTGIASSVYSYTNDGKDPTLAIFGVNLQKNKRAVQAEAVVLRELARLTRELPSDAELERAKNRINFAFYEGLNGNGEKANFLGRYETTTDNFETGLQQQRRIQSVTGADVQAVVRKYFGPKTRTVITAVKSQGGAK